MSGLLAIGLALSLPWVATGRTDTAPPVPALLLITLDTTRADHLGCYGAAFAKTPNLDALSAGGVRFDAALSPTPLTLPSHATMMTGLVPRRHGVRSNARFRLDGDVPVLAEALAAAGYETAAFVSAAVLDRITGLGRGFATYDDRVRVGERAAFNYEERAASQVTDSALAWLATRDGKTALFLWVHYFDPHLPYVPPEPFRSRLAGRPYDGEIAFLDHEVGRLVAAVRGKWPALRIAVAGDHGESLGQHGEEAHGVFLYQATQRVPLILVGPGVPPGRVVSRNVGLVDLAPTLLDLLRLPPLPDADGAALTTLWTARAREPDEAAAGPDYELESFFPRFSYGWAPLRALVRGPLKYVEAPEPELYDLTADPGERDNRIAERAGHASALRAALQERIGDDDPGAPALDPALAEQRERLEALGYLGGGTSAAPDEEIDPKRAISWLRELDEARRSLQTGEPERAIPILESLLKKSPRTLPALLTLAQSHLGAGSPDDAIAVARRAVELSPDDELARFHLANALSAKARSMPEMLPEARAAYEAALERQPRRADTYLNYAALLLSRVSPDAARELLERARAAGVEDPDVELELGLLALKAGDAGAARAAFERSVALNPCSDGVHEALGRLAYDRREMQRAVRHYRAALECGPSAALAKTLGSIYLYELDDATRARAAFLRAIELSDPRDPDVATLRQLLRDLPP